MKEADLYFSSITNIINTKNNLMLKKLAESPEKFSQAEKRTSVEAVETWCSFFKIDISKESVEKIIASEPYLLNKDDRKVFEFYASREAIFTAYEVLELNINNVTRIYYRLHKKKQLNNSALLTETIAQYHRALAEKVSPLIAALTCSYRILVGDVFYEDNELMSFLLLLLLLSQNHFYIGQYVSLERKIAECGDSIIAKKSVDMNKYIEYMLNIIADAYVQIT
ncbi:MAG: hypothetical protein Q4C64_01990 [Erysipelotrichia bacterium]|nr:hypothetical protein [Erysipelotrichia bacterium]